MVGKAWLYESERKDMSRLSIHMLSAVVAVKDGNILLQKGAFAARANYWALPEANLKFGEDPVACARRALNEQANVKASDLALVDVQSSVYEKTHWDLWYIYRATVKGEPSPGGGKWKAQFFSISKLPRDLDPEDKPEVERWAKG